MIPHATLICCQLMRPKAITSLAPEHLPEVIQALKTILGDPVPDPWTRVYAARAMVRLDFDKYEEVIGMLTELANSSSDPDHRFVAARGLACSVPPCTPTPSLPSELCLRIQQFRCPLDATPRAPWENSHLTATTRRSRSFASSPPTLRRGPMTFSRLPVTS